MLMNILFGLLIFSYSGWALTRYFQKAKQGKCAACSLNESCSDKVCESSVEMTSNSSTISNAHTI